MLTGPEVELVGSGRFELPTCRLGGSRAFSHPSRTTAHACALPSARMLTGPEVELVGTGRFELPTCRLGGGRSIQLSYVPAPLIVAGLHRRKPFWAMSRR